MVSESSPSRSTSPTAARSTRLRLSGTRGCSVTSSASVGRVMDLPPDALYPYRVKQPKQNHTRPTGDVLCLISVWGACPAGMRSATRDSAYRLGATPTTACNAVTWPRSISGYARAVTRNRAAYPRTVGMPSTSSPARSGPTIPPIRPPASPRPGRIEHPDDPKPPRPGNPLLRSREDARRTRRPGTHGHHRLRRPRRLPRQRRPVRRPHRLHIPRSRHPVRSRHHLPPLNEHSPHDATALRGGFDGRHAWLRCKLKLKPSADTPTQASTRNQVTPSDQRGVAPSA